MEQQHVVTCKVAERCRIGSAKLFDAIDCAQLVPIWVPHVGQVHCIHRGFTNSWQAFNRFAAMCYGRVVRCVNLLGRVLCTEFRTTLYALRHVLNVLRKADPFMFSVFVDRKCWARKAGFSEGSDWNCKAVFNTFKCVVNRCPAVRAEVKRSPAAVVTNSNVLTHQSLKFDGIASESGLNAQHAASPLLTHEAMTDRHANGFSDSVAVSWPQLHDAIRWVTMLNVSQS